VGAYVPQERLTNEDLSRIVETDDEWIRSRTGIRERRIAPKEEGTSHLAARAAREALEHAGVSPEAVDLIILATCTPDMTIPPSACLVQAELGATRAAAFDINAVCSGFLYAMTTGAQFIRSGVYRHVLVIGADTYSRIIDYKDRTTCILFGDGAGAVLLSRCEAGQGLLDFTLHADGSQAGMIYRPHADSPSAVLQAIGADPEPFFRQTGKSVFKLAVGGMAGAVEQVLERNGLTAADLRVLVPHQANQRIMASVADRLGIEESRVARCIEEYGNTSAATIPLALHKWAHTEGLKQGDLVMLCAFGAGLLWGSALLRWV
jgi:3-oxoacyl-[acyl-carrier-protein] synthase III